MGMALAIHHGEWGRAALYRLNKAMPPHAHREGHLVILVEGMPGRVKVDGQEVRVDRAFAAAVSPWQPHDFFPSDFGGGAIFLTLYIAPRWFAAAAGEAGAALRFGCAAVEIDAAMAQTVRAVVDGMVHGRSVGRVAGLIHDLSLSAYEASWRGAAATGTVHRIADYRIRNAMRLMADRVADACDLDRVARDCGLSRPHFYKLFRQNFGITPNMYLNTLRLERSIDRLTRTDDPVTAIGLDLGFATQASFTRFFSANIGIAPTDYRRVCQLAA